MAGYSEQNADMQQVAFVRQWTEGVELPPLTEDNLRWNIARTRAAEDELRRLKQALATLKAAVQ